MRELSVLVSCVFFARGRSIPTQGVNPNRSAHGWTQLMFGPNPRSQRRRRRVDDLESRVIRAENLVHVGEFPLGKRWKEMQWRQAPKRHWTSCKMCNAGLLNQGRRCTSRLWVSNRRHCSSWMRNSFGETCEGHWEPSGMTCEHLRPLLDEGTAVHLLFKLGENLARAHVPQVAVRSGRLTTLSQPDGGVRGIVSGDVTRRCTNDCQQMGEAVKSASVLHQCAL